VLWSRWIKELPRKRSAVSRASPGLSGGANSSPSLNDGGGPLSSSGGATFGGGDYHLTGSPPSMGKPVVVVPCYARTAKEVTELSLTVASALASGAPHVVVIDDGSRWPAPLVPLHDDRVHSIRHTTNLGPAAARNSGIRAARALAAELGRSPPSCFILLDSGCIADPPSSPGGPDGWYAAHIRHQAQQPGLWSGETFAAGNGSIDRYHDVMGTLMGPPLAVSPSDAPNADVAVEQDRTPGLTSSRVLLYAPTANLSISADAWDAIGGFDEDFPTAAYEDVDFCLRAAALGYPTRQATGAIVRHRFDRDGTDADRAHRPRLLGSHRLAAWREFAAAFWRYGRAEPLLTARHPDYLLQLGRSTASRRLLGLDDGGAASEGDEVLGVPPE